MTIVTICAIRANQTQALIIPLVIYSELPHTASPIIKNAAGNGSIIFLGVVCGSVILFGFIFLWSILENGIKYLASQSVNNIHIIDNIQTFCKIFCDQQCVIIISIRILMANRLLSHREIRDIINNNITCCNHNFYSPFAFVIIL